MAPTPTPPPVATGEGMTAAKRGQRQRQRDGPIQHQRQVVRRAVERPHTPDPLHIHPALPRRQLPQPDQADATIPGQETVEQRQGREAAAAGPRRRA